MLTAIARRDGVPVLMCNQAGGNDSLIFDGSSLAVGANGKLIAQAASFAEDLVIIDPFAAAPLPEDPTGETRPKQRIRAAGSWEPGTMFANAAFTKCWSR